MDHSTSHTLRRHSEASASYPQIIQHKTPTKTHKFSQLLTETFNCNHLADSFVILETPPRPKTTTQIHQNDLTSTVRRLFPQKTPKDQ